MAFSDPFAAYDARDLVEAHLVHGLIVEAGIEAQVVDDVSVVGLGQGGPLPGIHKPQVWVERADADRVRPILDEYEQREKERRARNTEQLEDIWAETVKVECSNCEQTLSFPAARRGSIEICPRCGNYVDVEDSDDGDEWWLTDGQHDEQS